MRIPFGRELDETFRSDRSVWIKMAGAAFVADFSLILGTSKMSDGDRTILDVLQTISPVALAIMAMAGAGTALLLCKKDVIHRRMALGERVNPILKLYLGMGIWSLVAWFPTAFFLGIVLIIVTH